VGDGAGIMTGTPTRRVALTSASAAGAFLLASTAFAGRGPSKFYVPPRKLTDHAVVYRSYNECARWPHVVAYWNMGDGETSTDQP